MTPDSPLRSAKLADQLMAIDVFSELLASTDPQQLGQKLTEQLRELTGARTVALLAHPAEEGSPHALIHVCPERRATLFNREELGLFCPHCTPTGLPSLTAQLPPGHPLRTVLQRVEVLSLLRVPLRVRGEIVSTLLLLDLPEPERLEEVATIVTRLAPVIALALKNAFAQERIAQQALALQTQTKELEQRVAERTAALEEANRSLNSARLGALNLMEDAVATRQRAEESNAALQREMVERNCAEEALRQTQQRLELAQRAAGAGVWDWDMTTGRLDWSPELFSLFGLDPVRDRATLDDWKQTIHPDDRVAAAQRLEQAIKDGTLLESEYRIALPDGRIRWINALGRTTYDANRRPVRMAGICLDTTSRKEAESALQRSEALFRSTFDNAPVGAAIVGLDQSFQQVNTALCRFIGYTAEELLGMAFAQITHPDDVVDSVVNVRRLLGGEIASFELVKRYLRKGGEEVWGRVSVSLIRDEAGQPLYLLPLIQDITERKRTEEALQQSEKRYATTLAAVNDGLWEWHVPSGNAYFSPSYYSLLGYAPDAFVANYANWRTLIHPEDIQRVETDLRQSVGAGRGFAIDLRMRTRTGDWLWVATRGNAVERDPAGRVLRMAGTLSDISQRKQAELELEQFFALVPDMVCIASGDGFFRNLNDEWVRVLGYSKEELMAIPYAEFVHPEDRAATRHESAQQAAGNYTASFVNRYRAKDGTYHWFEWNATSANEKNILFAAARDITKHRQAEQALRESEEKFAKVFHDAPVWIAITDLGNAQYLDVNDAVLHAAGFTREEVIGHSAAEIGWITAEDRARLLQEIQVHGRIAGMELAFRTKDGRRLHGLVTGEQITLGGHPRLLTVTLDITERRKAEQSLRESEEKFAKVFHAAPAWVGITDLATATYVDINEEALRLSGFTREEVIGHTSAELGWISAEDRARLVQNVREHGRVIGLELTVHDKAGRPLNGWLSSELISIGGRPSMLTIIVDITERKRAEELIAWEAALVENSSDVCSIKDLDLRVRAVNKAFLVSAGVATAAEVLGKTDIEIFQRQGNEANIEGFMADERRAQALPAGEYISRLETMLRPDGTEQILLTRKFPVFNSSGQLIATANISSDVTEHQRLEEALHRNERRYRQLFSSNVAGAALHEIVCDAAGHPCDYRFLEVNPAFEELTGLSSAALVGHTVLDVMPQTEPVWIERYGRVALTGNSAHFEQFSAVLNRHYEVSAYCPQPGQFAVLVLDVTERKRAEEELANTRATLEAAFEQSPLPMVLVSMPDAVLRIVNPASRELLGIMDEPSPVGQRLAEFKATYQDYDAKGHLTPVAEAPLALALTGRKTTDLERRIVTKAGVSHWALASGNPIYNDQGSLIAAFLALPDITERKRAEEALRSSLHEKEALLKEVHHRVKNNLQVISSLLRLESGRVADPATQAVLRDMQNRIRTMALLHESLYRSGNLAEVDMKAYLETLCQQLFRAASARSSGPVELQMAVAPMRIELNRTVPCGLIVNELVSNCLKHAFPEGRGGRVRVELQPTSVPEEWSLCVSDNGIGLPASFTLANLPSLGLQLVSDLTRQLQGRLEIAPHSGAIAPRQGAAFTVYFNALPPEPRPIP